MNNRRLTPLDMLAGGVLLFIFGACLIAGVEWLGCSLFSLCGL